MKRFLILMLLTGNCYAGIWQCIDSKFLCHTWRMKTHESWIVSGVDRDLGSYAMVFVPDKNHEWKV